MQRIQAQNITEPGTWGYRKWSAHRSLLSRRRRRLRRSTNPDVFHTAWQARPVPRKSEKIMRKPSPSRDTSLNHLVYLLLYSCVYVWMRVCVKKYRVPTVLYARDDRTSITVQRWIQIKCHRRCIRCTRDRVLSPFSIKCFWRVEYTSNHRSCASAQSLP
jgi:hypothetical protein